MRAIITSFILLFTSLTLQAQTVIQAENSGPTSTKANEVNGMNTNSSFGMVFFNRPLNQSYTDARLTYHNIKGSPYLTEEPVKGRIVLKDGTEYKDVLLSADLYSDEIIVTTDEGEEYFLDKSFIWEVIMPVDGKELIFKKMDFKNPNDLYIKLYQDQDLLFFKKKYATIRQGENHGVSKTEPKFNLREKYFVKHGGGVIEKVNLTKKDILAGFKERDAKKIQSYAKANGLKLRKEEDFVTVFEAVRTESQN